MSPSFSLQKGDVSCAAAAAKDAQRPNISVSDRLGDSPKSPWTTPPQRPDSNSHDTMLSQTPDNGRMWTPLVHISGGSKEPRSPTLRPQASTFHTSSNLIEGLNDIVNSPSNPPHTADQSTTETPPFYAALHDIADDGKTLGCNRTLTFDTFVEKAQLHDNHVPLEKTKRRHRERFRGWIKRRAKSLCVMRKSR